MLPLDLPSVQFGNPELPDRRVTFNKLPAGTCVSHNLLCSTNYDSDITILRNKHWATTLPFNKPGTIFRHFFCAYGPQEQAALYMTAFMYLLATMVSIVFIRKLICRMNGVVLAVPSLWIIACLAVANLCTAAHVTTKSHIIIVRAVYFTLLGAEMPSQSTLADVALMELPLMLRFSACLLMALFWYDTCVRVTHTD